MGGVRTSIIGRPRPLPRHRRARDHYTLNCEEPVNPVTMLGKYPSLAQVARDNISTDIPANELSAWVELVQRVQKATISSLTFTADNINTTHPDFVKMRQRVQAAVLPPATPSTTTTTTPTTGLKTTTTRPGPSTSTTRPPDGDAPVNVRDAC